MTILPAIFGKRSPTLSEHAVLLASLATIGAPKETLMRDSNTFYWVCDIAGDNAEQRKWACGCSGADILIFTLDATAYGRSSRNDLRKGQWEESLDIWWEARDALSEKPVIIVITFCDLLPGRLLRVPIVDSWPDFPGDPWSASDVQRYLRDLILSRFQPPIYTVITTGLSETGVETGERVFRAIGRLLNAARKVV